MSLCSEWIELLQTLNTEKARYLVIGGHAYALHVEPRYTGDLDLWVEPTEANAKLVWSALTQFGAPLGDTSLNDFTRSSLVFQMGIVPNRVDILCGIEGVTFGEAWKSKQKALLGDVPVFIISRDLLIRNKLAAGRAKDLLDVKMLRKSKPTRRRKR